jgi:hypothetical protein
MFMSAGVVAELSFSLTASGSNFAHGSRIVEAIGESLSAGELAEYAS